MFHVLCPLNLVLGWGVLFSGLGDSKQTDFSHQLFRGWGCYICGMANFFLYKLLFLRLFWLSWCNTKKEMGLVLGMYKQSRRPTIWRFHFILRVVWNPQLFQIPISPEYSCFSSLAIRWQESTAQTLLTACVYVACNPVLTTLVIQTFISAAEVASSGDTRFPVLCDGLQTFHLHSSSVQHFPGIKGVRGLLGLRQLFFITKRTRNAVGQLLKLDFY